MIRALELIIDAVGLLAIVLLDRTGDDRCDRAQEKLLAARRALEEGVPR